MSAYLTTINNPWRVVDELLSDFPYDLLNSAWRAQAGRFPRVNVWENDRGIALEAEVAGIDPGKLDVSVDANVLTIKGEKPLADGTSREFQRSFNLPFELEREHIKAAAKNGILSVTIPRRASEKRRIAIEQQ
ncbi:MAG: Hsp20/alpha crystallin family protein [Verrucomicrobiota bacterium]|jgi:HSP20 family protein|nr:Hsp20/alpha crystallin family protein [Verrucomicrobiota bacterium]